MVKEARFAFDDPYDYQFSDLEARHLESLESDRDIDWIDDLKLASSKKSTSCSQNKKNDSSKIDSINHPLKKNTGKKHLAGADWLKDAS